MLELIKVKTSTGGKKVVSARELHEFLGAKTEFKDWMPRMLEYGFTDKIDFSSFLSESTGGRPSIDYILSIDCAKEIAMIQRTDKGKQARLYFIECEKIAKQIKPLVLPTRLEYAQLLLNAETEKEVLQLQNDLQAAEITKTAPLVKYSKEVLQSTTGIRTTLIAKEFGMSAIAFNDKLCKMSIQYKQNGTWVLFAKYQNLGYTQTVTTPINTSDGPKTVLLTVWTETGRLFIHNLFNEKLKTA